MKRKASHLDGEGDNSSWISRSPLSESSVGSFNSPDRIFKPVPWLMYPSAPRPITNGPNPRTRKRFRDNRPDISTIHQSTLAKLYNAQKAEQPARSEPEKLFPAPTNQTAGQHEHQQNTIMQKSLHSFFNIRQPEPVVASPAPHQARYIQDLTDLCSDCGNHLSSQCAARSEDHNMMDIDLCLVEDYSCTVCQRVVCDTCAVRGDQRICLECALPGRG